MSQAKPKTKTAAKTAARKPATNRPLELTYDLAALPTAQHRAGLAGLVLMCRWLVDRNPERLRGICELTRIDAHGATVRIDRAGLASLFDMAYGADTIERAYPKPFSNKKPLREETRTETSDKTGKTSEKTVYIYPVVVPRGAYLGPDWEGGDSGPWLKLWRDMVWTILRGVPATRAPFEGRTHTADIAPGTGDEEDVPGDVDDTWTQLGRKDAVVDLPSTYYLGAQARTAENVRFRDLARHQLLLHFWPFVAQIYIPAVIDAEGKRTFRGYALALPDVACLDDFCDELPGAMRDRGPRLAGYVPAEAVVDLALESALDFMARLLARMASRGNRTLDLVHGVDVFHVEKEGNNIRILGTGRVHANPAMTDEYERLRKTFRDSRFRRQQLMNLIEGHPWYAGYDRLAATVPIEQIIESTWFRADARRAFEHSEKTMNDSDRTAKNIETLIYRLVGSYINTKLATKYDTAWNEDWRDEDKQKSDDYKKYRDAREKIAKDAFLAIRSRTGADFVDYFAGTLCSGFQRLNEQDYAVVARALLDKGQIENVRTLTLLALSARA